MAKDVDQVSAVQKVDNTLYQADKGYENRLNYPVNSDMHHLNKWDQKSQIFSIFVHRNILW